MKTGSRALKTIPINSGLHVSLSHWWWLAVRFAAGQSPRYAAALAATHRRLANRPLEPARGRLQTKCFSDPSLLPIPACGRPAAYVSSAFLDLLFQERLGTAIKEGSQITPFLLYYLL